MRTTSRIARGEFALATALILACVSGPVMAQTGGQNSTSATASNSGTPGVRLFNSWVADAVFTPGVDLEPLFDMEFYDGGNLWFGGARVAAWVADGFEAGGRIGWAGYDPDEFDGDSSFADLDLYARFRVPVEFGGTLAAGSEVRLPTGSSDAGQDNTIVRIFGALRQDMSGAFTFTANLGFEYMELFGDDGNGLTMGLGSLVPLSDELTATVEFNLRTAFDYAMLTGGLDYRLPPGGHLRGAFGIGLDSEAPDAQVQIALALPVF